jgi:hypothetical protein
MCTLKPRSAIPLFVVTLLTQACGGKDAAPQEVSAPAEVYLAEVQDSAGNAPASDDAPLYGLTGSPITTPDGKAVSLRQFKSATGTVRVSCSEQGTVVTVDLQQLMPGAVYSVWNALFSAPGFDGTDENIEAFGAAGAGRGQDNWFTSSSTGTGSLSATTPAGSLSVVGDITACAVRDPQDYAIFMIYHMDGTTHGTTPGPKGSGVAQLVAHPPKMN